MLHLGAATITVHSTAVTTSPAGRLPSGGAFGHYLAHLGARGAAALFTNAGTTGA